MKNRFAAIALSAIVLSVASAPAAFSAPEMGSSAMTTGCATGEFRFANAVNPYAAAGSLSKGHSQTIAVLGRKGFHCGYSVALVCTSLDDSKAAFEAVKAYCKTARNAIASGMGNVSAARARIATIAQRPEDGYPAGSVVLRLQ